MEYPFPADLKTRVKSQMTEGRYKTEDDVIRAAISALEKEDEDVAAIQAGIADMEAGRYRPFADIVAGFREKHGIARDA